MQIEGLKYLYIIANPNIEDEIILHLRKNQGAFVTACFAKGMSVNRASSLDIGEYRSHILITCIIKEDGAKAMIKTLNNKYKFNVIHNGFAFYIPLEDLAV